MKTRHARLISVRWNLKMHVKIIFKCNIHSWFPRPWFGSQPPIPCCFQLNFSANIAYNWIFSAFNLFFKQWWIILLAVESRIRNCVLQRTKYVILKICGSPLQQQWPTVAGLIQPHWTIVWPWKPHNKKLARVLMVGDFHCKLPVSKFC